jgi:hypothetical protein
MVRSGFGFNAIVEICCDKSADTENKIATEKLLLNRAA